MAKKKATEETGILNLIEYNPKIIENGSKTPNILIDNFVGVCIDEYNYELVKIKQVTVTEDNIKSTTNSYEDKYTLGDTYQEWISMGKYLGDFIEAVEVYSQLKFKNETSKLKYCTDVSKLNNIRQAIHDDLHNYIQTNTVPEVAKQINAACKDLQTFNASIEKYRTLTSQVEKTCNELIGIVEEKRAKMVSKGIIEQKKTNHKAKEEKE